MPVKDLEDLETSNLEARRAFLRGCAKYAVAMPPAISLLMSADEAFADPVKKCSEFCADPSPPQPPSCECGTPESDPALNPSLFQSPEEEEFNSTNTQTTQ